MTIEPKWLLIAVAGVFPALAIGYGLGVAASSNDVTPVEPASEVPEPVVEESVEPVLPNLERGPRPPGQWPWAQLRGGECVEDFGGSFAEIFFVVPCESPHDAEFVRATIIDSDPDASYPGDEQVRERAQSICEDWELDSLTNPERYDDLVVVPGYSFGEQAWDKGDRLAGCFVYREGGGQLEGPLAVG